MKVKLRLKMKVNEDMKSDTDIIITMMTVAFRNAKAEYKQSGRDRALIYNTIYDTTPYRLLVIIEKVSSR